MADKVDPNLIQLLMQRAGKGISDFGGAVKESTVDIGQGVMDAFNTTRGDIPTVTRGAMGMIESGKDFAAASPMGRLGVAGEVATGLPVRQIANEVGAGEYSKAAGHAAPGILAAIAGLKAGRAAAPKMARIPAPRPRLVPNPVLDSRVSGLPPAFGSGRPPAIPPPSPYEAVMRARAGLRPPLGE